MDVDSLKERLRKMKALADFGYGGERDAAELTGVYLRYFGKM